MIDPSFDIDGYPTDETLDRIRTWTVNTSQDAVAAMDFAGSAWYYPDMWIKTTGYTDPDWPNRTYTRYMFSTIGWSGNESIVSAIEENMMLQLLGAWSWRRGGHYEYRFPENA